MLALKMIGKILLLPVWVILAVTWLVIHFIIGVFSVFHLLWKIFFTVFIILAILFGMYQNALIFTIAIGATFLVLLAGSAVDILLEEARKGIGSIITR